MKNLYRILRDTHLALGVFTFLALLVYGVSSLKFTHRDWFPGKPEIRESQITLADGQGDSPRAIARELMEKHGVRGELRQVRKTDAGFHLRIARAGTFYDIDYSRADGTASVRTTRNPFSGMLVSLHVLAGTWYQMAGHDVWGVVVFIFSIAMILLGLSGIYLWFKIHQERKIGLALLTVNLVYSVTLMVLIRGA